MTKVFSQEKAKLFITAWLTFICAMAISAYSYSIEYDQTMVWKDDFTQTSHGLGPMTCVYCKGQLCMPLPTCSVTVKYTEPTVHLETAGKAGQSVLMDMSEFENNRFNNQGNNDLGLMTGGRAGVIRNKKLSSYEARVWGISPQARFDSSSSEYQAKFSNICHLAKWGWTHWEYFTREDTTHPNILKGDRTEALEKATERHVVNSLEQWHNKWFEGSSKSRNGIAELADVYISEQNKDEWHPKVIVTVNNTTGSVTVSTSSSDGSGEKCGQSGRWGDDIERLKNLDFDPMDKSNNNCIGSWGSLLPRQGFAANTGNNMPTKALIAWKAYDRARHNNISLSPPMVQKETIGGEYWKTQYNIEHPYFINRRMETGNDSFEWEAVKNGHRAKSFNDMMAMGSGTPNISEDIEAGYVSTLWKSTSCRPFVCCNRWPADESWIAIDPWVIVGVTEWDLRGSPASVDQSLIDINIIQDILPEVRVFFNEYKAARLALAIAGNNVARAGGRLNTANNLASTTSSALSSAQSDLTSKLAAAEADPTNVALQEAVGLAQSAVNTAQAAATNAATAAVNAAQTLLDAKNQREVATREAEEAERIFKEEKQAAIDEIERLMR